MNKEKMISFRVKALILQNGRFLVLQRSDMVEKCWDLPGGGMEFGETAEETVVREVKEETGLVIKPIRLLDTWNSVGENHQFTGVIFLCHLEGGVLRLSPEHDYYDWIVADGTRVHEMGKVFKEKMEKWDWDTVVS